ncbi:hypothetical protein N7481_008402 [Penicillium waksmanii]|uniref:uncharacterized protein n=1 Tax=Penicillium waksmanii TaxID=69791 RepID=UPI0025496D19|nr:uncharacterized protein N7481_008402 [Penicillium waksmanii]KAJ5981104.1 hypothetical protein N7481_008402 [Penicillium waksmanii]
MIQLWLFTLRHFVYDSPKVTTSRDYQTPHQILTFQALALLAKRLGFSSNSIENILSKSQGRVNARNFIDEISTDEFLSLDEPNVKAASNCSASFLTLLQVNDACADGVANLTTENLAEKAQRRFCRPVASQYREQRGSFFIEQIFGPAETVAEYPTSLAITRDILLCFFGDKVVDGMSSRIKVNSVSGESMYGLSDTNILSAVAAEDDTAVFETHGDKNDIHSQGAFLGHELTRKTYPLPSLPGEESLYSNSVSTPSHPIGSPDHMTLRNGLAAGFEDELTIGDMGVKLYITHHGRFSEILNMWHYSNNQNLMVVYLFEDRIFYKFRATDNFALRSFLNNLARDYILMEIHADYELSIPRISEMELANHLIVACRKESPAKKKLQGADMSMDEFRNYIRSCDIHTGKRYSEKDIGRFAKRR